MKRNIITTRDGSTTIHLEEWDECYHSRFGAIQEAQHVFIKNGLDLFPNQEVSILEIGFGTGLNAFVSFLETQKTQQKINYVGIEAYPVLANEAALMNYVSELNAQEYASIFHQMHKCSWEQKHQLSTAFSLCKRQQFFEKIDDSNQYELIYFDAFGYDKQPELWSEAIFKIKYAALKPNGILTTYAARTIIKKNMIAAGFTVEKLPGAPGKREMFRAKKGV